jgi:hypothetical protein
MRDLRAHLLDRDVEDWTPAPRDLFLADSPSRMCSVPM